MKIKVFVFLFVFLLVPEISFSTIYNPTKEIETKLIVLSLANVPMYGQKDFVLITAKSESSDKVFVLEVSPRWFLKEEFFNKIRPNRKILVIGSLSEKNWIVVRKITSDEYSIILRTKQGFPLWRVN